MTTTPDSAPERIWMADNDPSERWPLYTRGNVGEVFPLVVYPLSWSIYGGEAENGWRQAYRDFGVVAAGDFGDDPMVILGVFGGYCYINASYVRMVGLRAPGSSVEAIDQQFFGESDAPPYVPRPGDKNLKASLRIAKGLGKTLFAKSLPALEEDKQKVDEWLASVPPLDSSDEELLAVFTRFQPVFRHLFHHHLLTTTQVTVGAAMVAELCEKKLGDLNLQIPLLGGIGDVESAAPSTSLWALGRQVAVSPELTRVYDEGFDGLDQRLAAEPMAAEYLVAFGAFIDEFGFRGPNEWDLSSDTWELKPRLAHAAVDRMRNAASDHAPGIQSGQLKARRAEATAEARSRLSRPDRVQFDRALASAHLFSQGRERSKTSIIRAVHSTRLVQRELARRAHERGGPADPVDSCLLTLEEFTEFVADPTPWLDTIAERRARHLELSERIPPFVFSGPQPPPDTWERRDSKADVVDPGAALQGIAGCAGKAQGRARVVLDPSDPGSLGPGDVLVAPITDPSWTPLFVPAEAVVVDVGAVMSHAVIVSRELGIPCVVSVTDATRKIPDGALIEVDGDTGQVTVLELP
ncbi:MAG: phosphoenolpyruvate-utilizing protein [Actinomycetia bacterium]|nr:phosphoenolpyruvate-utilizing protein [Actinomycetes bacterium]